MLPLVSFSNSSRPHTNTTTENGRRRPSSSRYSFRYLNTVSNCHRSEKLALSSSRRKVVEEVEEAAIAGQVEEVKKTDSTLSSSLNFDSH